MDTFKQTCMLLDLPVDSSMQDVAEEITSLRQDIDAQDQLWMESAQVLTERSNQIDNLVEMLNLMIINYAELDPFTEEMLPQEKQKPLMAEAMKLVESFKGEEYVD